MDELMKEELFIQSLDELEAGAEAAQILARHPEHAAELQKILLVAEQLGGLAQEPAPAAEESSRDLLLAHAGAMRRVRSNPRPRWGWWRRLALGLTVVVLLFVAALTLTEESVSALPGDTLYPVKRARENVMLMIAGGDDSQLETRLQDERILEIKALLQLGREAEVTCRGFVDQIGEEIWSICNLEVTINAETVIDGAVVEGSAVIVEGITRGTSFFAKRIVIQGTANGDAAVPLAAPTATATTIPTQEPTPEPTPLPSATPQDERDGDDPDDAEIEKHEEPDEESDVLDEASEDPNHHDGDDVGGANNGPGTGDDDDDDDSSGSGSDIDDGDDHSGSGAGDDDDGTSSGSGNGGDNDDSDDDPDEPEERDDQDDDPDDKDD